MAAAVAGWTLPGDPELRFTKSNKTIFDQFTKNEKFHQFMTNEQVFEDMFIGR